MAARCPITRGSGSLTCCRVVEHPTANGPAVHAGCCLHSTLLGGVLLHAQLQRIGNGHPLTCNRGAALDSA